MHTITNLADHIRLTFKNRVPLAELRGAVAEVTALPDYPHKNDLWLLDDCQLELGYDALAIIVDDLLRHAPPKSGSRKTALVSESGLTSSIMHLLVQEAQVLPYETRAFDDQQDAEKWLGMPKERRAPAREPLACRLITSRPAPCSPPNP